MGIWKEDVSSCESIKIFAVHLHSLEGFTVQAGCFSI